LHLLQLPLCCSCCCSLCCLPLQLHLLLLCHMSVYMSC
jgi:hypothetical protein